MGFGVHGHPARLVAWSKLPARFHLELPWIETHHLAGVFNVHVDGPRSVGRRELGLAAQVYGPGHFACLPVDRGCALPSPVEREYLLCSGVIQNGIRILAGRYFIPLLSVRR